jgi:hypothetical protein
VSLLGQVGSERAAEEIAAFVRKRIEAVKQYRSGAALVELETVLKFCEEIREAAKTGWY